MAFCCVISSYTCLMGLSSPGSNAVGAACLLQQEMERQRFICTVAGLTKTELISQLVLPWFGFRKEWADGVWKESDPLLAVYASTKHGTIECCISMNTMTCKHVSVVDLGNFHWVCSRQNISP